MTWVATDGIRYQRPEVPLALKAAVHRPQDTADLGTTTPLLEPERRRWLADTVARLHPGDPWLDRLR